MVEFPGTKEIIMRRWIDQGFLSKSGTRNGRHDGTYLCYDALRKGYPGDNWRRIPELVLIVSKKPFKDCLEGQMPNASYEVARLLGVDWIKATNDYSIPVYWAAQVLI